MKKSRNNMPSKSKIAEFWLCDSLEGKEWSDIKDDPFLVKLAMQDWGEPACWACGAWEYREGEGVGFSDWSKDRFLQRCHIVPHAKGGSNNVDNLLLLCRQCHKDAPDLINPKYMKRFVARRKPFMYVFCQEAKDIPSEALKYASDNIEAFEVFFREISGFHPGSCATNDYLFAMEEFYEQKVACQSTS